MRVWVRADASSNIGGGHLIRCLALALAMRDSGADVTFYCRTSPGHLLNEVARHKFEAISLQPQLRDDQGDIDEMLEHSNCGLPDLVIVDHYSLGECWEGSFVQLGCSVLALDDCGRRPHRAHWLLDQNPLPDPDEHYAPWVSPYTRLLSGPGYSLLRPEFVAARQGLDRRTGPIGTVLLSFGGSDPPGFTFKSLQALKGHDDWEIEVVAGAANPRIAQLRDLCHQFRTARLHIDTREMPYLMQRCQIAIGAPGSTTWERCCLGLPALVVSLADNQRINGERGESMGIHHYLGWHADVSPDQIHQAFSQLVQSPNRLRTMSEQGLKLVDGLGASRVAAMVLTGVSG